MDLTLFRYLNDFVGHGGFVDGMIVFFASYLQYVIALALVALAFTSSRRFRMMVAAVISGVVARMALKPIIVMFIHRARPYVALQAVHNIIGPQTGEEYQSFPSGHALFFFALAAAIYMYDKRLGWWFFAGAILMGLARVTGGIHWPTDIIGGAGIGILTAWLLIRLIPALRPRQ